MKGYIVTLLSLPKATRENEWTELGISTRGTVALTKMAKAAAYLQGRNYVIPSDVMDVFEDVGDPQDHIEYEGKSGTYQDRRTDPADC